MARGLRDRYLGFIGRHDVAWELTFAALAILYTAVAFAPEEAELALFGAVETALTAVFVAEFGSRFAASYDRRAYLRGHWIDLLALIPMIRGVRVFRVLRLLRLVRTFVGVGRALSGLERFARHRPLVWLLVAWAAVMLLTSLGLYAAEKGVNAAVDSPLDALWWGITTMTTVGYGDVYPVTPEGRLAAAVLMILGIGLYSAITATVTTVLLEGRATDPDPVDQLRRLAELHATGAVDDRTFQEATESVLSRLRR